MHFSFLQRLLVLRLPNMNTRTHEPMFYNFREKQYIHRCLAVLTIVFWGSTAYYGKRIPVAYVPVQEPMCNYWNITPRSRNRGPAPRLPSEEQNPIRNSQQ